jgi:hypothetical protein
VPMKISRATVLELRKSIRSRSHRWLLIAAGVVGLLSAGLIAFTGPAEDHTFAAISFYTQISISLPLPFVSVLLMTQQFGRRASYVGVGKSLRAIIGAKLLASAVIAVAGAAYGVLISLVATCAAAPAADQGRWNARHDHSRQRAGAADRTIVRRRLGPAAEVRSSGNCRGRGITARTLDRDWCHSRTSRGSGLACALQLREQSAVRPHGR